MRNFTVGLLVSLLTATSLHATSKPPLFERLGGKKGVAQIAHAFVDILSRDRKLLADPKLNELQKKSDRNKIKARLSDEICKASGGPCQPERSPLVESTTPVHLDMMQWLDVIQDANRALEKCKVPHQERAELLSLLLAARNQQ